VVGLFRWRMRPSQGTQQHRTRTSKYWPGFDPVITTFERPLPVRKVRHKFRVIPIPNALPTQILTSAFFTTFEECACLRRSCYYFFNDVWSTDFFYKIRLFIRHSLSAQSRPLPSRWPWTTMFRALNFFLAP